MVCNRHKLWLALLVSFLFDGAESMVVPATGGSPTSAISDSDPERLTKDLPPVADSAPSSSSNSNGDSNQVQANDQQPAANNAPVSFQEVANLLTNVNDLTKGLTATSEALDFLKGLNLDFRNLPDIVGFGEGSGAAASNFANPIGNLITSRSFQAKDVQDVVNAIPDLVKKLPEEAQKEVDFTKIDPQLIENIVEGKPVIGVPDSTVQEYLALYMQQMVRTASRALEGDLEAAKLLPQLEDLPASIVSKVLGEEPIGGLAPEDVSTLVQFYSNPHPLYSTPTEQPINGSLQALGVTVDNLLERLPPNFDLARVPKEIIRQVTAGEPVNLLLLPQDLLRSFAAHNADLQPAINQALTQYKDRGLFDEEELVSESEGNKQLQQTQTGQGYDVNLLDTLSDVKDPDQSDNSVWLYTAIGACCLVIVVFVLVAVYLYRRRMQRRATHKAALRGVMRHSVQPARAEYDSFDLEATTPSPKHFSLAQHMAHKPGAECRLELIQEEDSHQREFLADPRHSASLAAMPGSARR